jgi:hypothetical protein
MATADIPLKDNKTTADFPQQPIPASQFDPVGYLKLHNPESAFLRYAFERNWYRNVLFYVGKQWIKYDKRKRQWIKPSIPEWMPLPVTNKYASTCDAMASVLEQVKPTILYTPSRDTPDCLAASDVCNAIVDVISTEVEEHKLDQETRMWLVLTGNVFWLSYYDNDAKWGTVDVPAMTCQQCGKQGYEPEFKGQQCPQCHSTMVAPMVDPQTGQPTIEKFPKGKITTECVSPFEFFADIQCRTMDSSPFIFRAKTYPVETIKDIWGDKAANIKPESSKENLGQFFMASLAYATNSSDSEFGVTYGQGDNFSMDRATVWQIWLRPCKQFPNGVYSVVCNEQVLEDSRELDYHDSDGRAFIPFVHIKFKDVPGRLFAKTPADDLIYKQVQRNKLESFIQLAMQRMSNPVWLLPQSCGVTDVTGEPGEKIRFNDSNALKSEPKRIGGVELTQSSFRWLAQIDDDFEELAATFDVIKGNVPKNTPTLGGLEVLRERGMSRFGQMISNWEQAKVELTRHWLYIWKEYAIDTRTRKIQGPNSRWILEQYNNASISGNVDVRPEPGSSSPRSEAYQQYIVGQLIQNGIIDIQDPNTKIKIFQKFHAVEFAERLDIDVKDALEEQDTFMHGGGVRLRPLIDNNETHMDMHIQLAKSEEFRNLPQQLQMQWYQHIEATQQVIQMKAMQQMQMQGPQQRPGLTNGNKFGKMNNSSGSVPPQGQGLAGNLPK